MSEEKNKIVCVHLLNDFSGSPLVLSTVIKRLIKTGYEVDMITSKGTTGFLSDIPGVNYKNFFYRWHPNKLITLLFFLYSQCLLFRIILPYRKENITLYINAVLPFGAALAGRLTNKKLIYHIHETSVKPELLKRFLFSIANTFSFKIIYVSEYLKNQETKNTQKECVVYNALSDDFVNKANQLIIREKPLFTVLMLCSMKIYKGVFEFIELAKRLPDIHFELVLNTSKSEMDLFFKNSQLPANIDLYPVQQNVHPFYHRASMVLNLSHPDKWVETFGMTVLEAMTYGLPVIVPEVGGIAELVEDGYNGYKISAYEINKIAENIIKIKSDKNLYQSLSSNAMQYSKRFSEKIFIDNILLQINLKK